MNNVIVAKDQKQPKQPKLPKNATHVVRRLLTYYKEYKWQFLITVVLAMVAACAAAVGIYYSGVIYQDYLVNDADWVNIFSSFLVICVSLFIVYIIGNLFNWLQNLITVKFSEKAAFKMRNEFFSTLQKLPIKYFDQTPSGELMSRLTNDINNIADTVSQYAGNFIYWFFTIISMLVTMFLINWILTLITLIIIPLMILINLFIIKKIKPYYFKQQKKIGQLNGFAEEMISGTKIISLFKMQDLVGGKFDKINDELTKDSVIAQATANIMMPINNFINNISFVILASLGISLIIIGSIPTDIGILNIDTAYSLLITFTLFARNFTNPINQIISTFGSVLFAIAGAQRVFEVLDVKPEQDSPTAKPIKNVKGHVEAKNLCFGYEPGQLVLKNINFISKPGEVTAIVGPTGAGKTTIVNLITKFYDLTSGQLLIDNVSIDQITRDSLRENITMVLQDTYLFGETILENIRYGRNDATEAEVFAAAKRANAEHFIMQLPKGYMTILEDNGSNLSQGQRQLLAIARSFLADSKIVILDEATSSIDTKTEMQIQTAMNQLMHNRTSFVIAHRLSTIKDADNILVLRDGEIVESGTHDVLLKKNGFYAELYNTQYKKGASI